MWPVNMRCPYGAVDDRASGMAALHATLWFYEVYVRRLFRLTQKGLCETISEQAAWSKERNGHNGSGVDGRDFILHGDRCPGRG